MALQDFFTPGNIAPPQVVTQRTGANQVMGTLEQIVGSNSPYIQNARRRGMETAATRGGINSSIAAGAAERSALESAAPMVNAALEMDQTGVNAQYENWLSQQNFNRQLQGSAFNSNLTAMQAIGEYALADPELYTPDVVSGFTNLFQQNLSETLKSYFGKPKSGGGI